MSTIPIKLPSSLAHLLEQRRRLAEPLLVPWAAALLLAGHRVHGSALPDGLHDSQQLLEHARSLVAAAGSDSTSLQIDPAGEGCLALLIDDAGKARKRPARGMKAATAQPPDSNDHASADHSGVSAAGKNADICLRVSAAEVTISSPGSRFDTIALHGWRRFLRHLLIELLHKPERALADIPNLGSSIRPLILNTWSGCADGNARLPQATVVERFDLQCRRSPDATAIRLPGGQPITWSYRELRTQSLQYAGWLQGMDVKPGDRVAMLLARRPESIALMLAVLRIGAVYVPIDPASPGKRLELMLSDCQPRLLLRDAQATPAHTTIACRLGIRQADIDQAGHEIQSPSDSEGSSSGVPELSERISPATLIRSRHSANHPAYVMYTSGSTGTPKGVVVPHRGIVRLVYRQYFAPLGPKTVMLQAAPLAFDASTLEIWGPLLNGGTCVIHPETVPSHSGLARVIRTEQVNTAWLTAALFNRLVDEDPACLHGLRTLMTGGEALSPSHVQRVLQALPGLQLINGYGPTECTTFAVTGPVAESDLATYRSVPLGRPINWTYVRVLTPLGEPTPPGLAGELYIGGPGVALGYLNQPALSRQRFVSDPFSLEADAMLYRTGDRVRWLDDGRLEYLGRLDAQLKIRGYRIEPGEIEAVLASHPAVRNAAITDECPPNGERRLVAWLVADSPDEALPEDESLRAHCRSQLPLYMMPARFVWVPHLPITLNGKLDRTALQALENNGKIDTVTLETPLTGSHVTGAETALAISLPNIHTDTTPTATAATTASAALQAEVIRLLKDVLSIDRLAPHDNFFEVGGSSLLAARALEILQQRFGAGTLGIEDFFGNPTAAAFAARIAAQGGMQALLPGQQPGASPAASMPAPAGTPAASPPAGSGAIAIIGMAARLPGADDIDQLWQNLIDGRDGIRHFRPEELDPSLPASLTGDPDYVAARGVMQDAARFDAAFFGISPREAELMDPQQRIFLELAWQCLENAGHAPRDGNRSIGVFAGMYNASYFQKNLRHYPERIAALGEFQVMLDNEKDYIATRTANRLNLQGPAVSVHTACSTSLVAIVQAVLSLRAGQCRMALAGGVAVTAPINSGYLYEAGSMLSPDGRTRSFDASAQGTVFSDGAAVVLLKRLEDAQRDRDTIHAVIRGVGLNNDGGNKASFTAPSVDGQHAVIRAALQDAGLPARSIQYVEGHGTATPMGDPVEVAALSRAWREQTQDSGFALLGSLKSHIGHTVIAAGAASTIKVALALRHQLIPGTLHFRAPNPALDLERSPFRISAAHTPWPVVPGQPRRAAISAFGVGGTNAHLIIEEAPAAPGRADTARENDSAPPLRLFPLSARTSSALAKQQQQLAECLKGAEAAALHPDDVSFTLIKGRSAFDQRLCVVAGSLAEAARALSARRSPDRLSGENGSVQRWVWLFPGQGAQYAGMGRALYQQEPVFAQAFDAALSAIASLSDDQAAEYIRSMALDAGNAGSSHHNPAGISPTGATAGSASGIRSAEAGTGRDGHAADAGAGAGAGADADADTASDVAVDTLIHAAIRGQDTQQTPAETRLRAEALRQLIFDGSDSELAQTSLTQPALFALEYALARFWQHQGLQPALMIGHSLGEFAAAVIAGVMRLEDAGWLVALRGRLIQALPAGAMLAVRLPAAKIRERLPGTLSIATINAPAACVVAGSVEAVEQFATELAADDIACQRLNTSHAFHSAMMRPAVAPFQRAVATVSLQPPRIALVSGRTGLPLEAGELTDPHYWAEQIRDTVRFADAAEQALATPGSAFLELGPGHVLSNLVSRSAAKPVCINSFGSAPAEESRSMARALARLWCLGALSLQAQAPAEGRRIALPTYPFEGKRYWLDAPPADAVTHAAPAAGPVHPAAAGPTAAPAAAMQPAAAVLPVPAQSSNLYQSSSMPDMPANHRQAALHQELAQTIDEVCGIEIHESDRERPFVELGLDSLLLTQLALQVKRHFKAPVTFRQLMTDLGSPAELVNYLDGVLPANAPLASSPAAASLPATGSPAQPVPPAASMAAPNPLPLLSSFPAASLPALQAGGGTLQQLLQQQLYLMEQQLRLLAGQPAPIDLPDPVAPAQPASSAQLASAADSPALTADAAAATAAPADEAKAGTEAADDRPTDDPKRAFGAIARIYRQQQDSLTPQQEARLDAFIQRYVAKTRASRDYTEKHRPHSADPRVVNGFRPRIKEMIYQIVIERSKGSHMWDLDGNEYVDALNGFGMSMFGWQPDFVLEAVRKQMDLGYDIGPQHPLSGPVTELVCEMTGFDRAALCNTGSEAVMGTVRIARTVTGRDRIAVFSGAYHGIFDEVIVRVGARGRAMPAAPGIMPNTAENVVILEYGDPAALAWIQANADTLAAVLVEPVQSRRPELQPREFLHELRRITETSGTLLIFDEVVTGFRTGPGGAQAHFGVRADLASYGKVIGGGFPIGIIAGKRQYMDALDGGAWQYGDDSIPTVGVTYFAGTFVRHPLALAACHAVLTHLKEAGPSLQQRLTEATTGLAEALNRFCREHQVPIEIRHFASVWRIVFTEDHPYQDLLFAMMRNRGIHILDNFPCFMTTAHTADDIEAIRQAFCDAVQELQADGFLPAPPEPESDETPDPARPPVPGARLGRDATGKAAWFVADPARPGSYIQLQPNA